MKEKPPWKNIQSGKILYYNEDVVVTVAEPVVVVVVVPQLDT